MTVEIDPAVPNQYLRLDSTSGFFVVSLKDITPYLDGFRVTLEVGNLTSARYVGFKLNATWGPRFDYSKYSAEAYQKWESQKQTNSFPYTDPIVTATWNKVDLILPSTSSSQLGFINVSIDTNIVSLGR